MMVITIIRTTIVVMTLMTTRTTMTTVMKTMTMTSGRDIRWPTHDIPHNPPCSILNTNEIQSHVHRETRAQTRTDFVAERWERERNRERWGRRGGEEEIDWRWVKERRGYSRQSAQERASLWRITFDSSEIQKLFSKHEEPTIRTHLALRPRTHWIQ